MGQKYVLPKCPATGPDKRWADRLVDTMQHAIDSLSGVVGVGIVVANDVVPPASFNPATATTTQTAQALATLITAFQKAGGIT